MEKRILEAIQSEPLGTYIEELARDLKLNRATVKNYVIVLHEKGLIKMEKKGSNKMLYPVE